MLPLGLNPDLDTERLAREYADHECVQIRNFLDEASAARLEAALPSLPWRLMAGMQRRAAEGIGHLYLVYPMINAALFGWDAGHAIHELTEFLNSKPVIEFARAISGKPGITKLDAHASCLLPGHYLNSHVDDGEIDERQVAYTIGFTRGWKSDWGGMLLVWDEHGDVRWRATRWRAGSATIRRRRKIKGTHPINRDTSLVDGADGFLLARERDARHRHAPAALHEVRGARERRRLLRAGVAVGGLVGRAVIAA